MLQSNWIPMDVTKIICSLNYKYNFKFAQFEVIYFPHLIQILYSVEEINWRLWNELDWPYQIYRNRRTWSFGFIVILNFTGLYAKWNKQYYFTGGSTLKPLVKQTTNLSCGRRKQISSALLSEEIEKVLVCLVETLNGMLNRRRACYKVRLSYNDIKVVGFEAC